MGLRLQLGVLWSLLAVPLALCAADWPQWRGPDRTDVSRETGLLRTWPEGGPPCLWTFTGAGIGYAGPAIVGDTLYTMGADQDAEYLYAVDLKTRKKRWNVEIGPLFSYADWGAGPRGTPTVAGDFVFCLSAKGNVVCAHKSSGQVVWMKNLTAELGGKLPKWGYSESPLVDGERLIVSPGGALGGIAALSQKDGHVMWQCKDLTDPAAYSSAIVADIAGVRQYIQLTMKGVAGVSATDGTLLWYHPKSEFKTAVIPSPLSRENCVYFTAGYNAGCELLKLLPAGDRFKVEQLYANRNMENHHGGVVLVGDHVYGYSDGKGWVCQDFKTGKIVWADNKSLEKGSLTCADGHLYCYGQKEGICALIEASPDGWKECGRLKIPRLTTVRSKNGGLWTHPVVANGRLYLRDQDLIFCFDVKDRK